MSARRKKSKREFRLAVSEAPKVEARISYGPGRRIAFRDVFGADPEGENGEWCLAPVEGLKFCTRVLGLLAEGNPRFVENVHWQRATEGVVGLRRDVEGLHRLLDSIVKVDFAVLDDPRQLRMAL